VLTGFEMAPVDMALLCQRAENEFVGMNCGIMDQFIALLGREDHALLIDCRSLQYRAVPIPAEGYRFVICDTRVPRELVDSEYNTRRRQCEEAVRRLKPALPEITALRAGLLPEPILKRARHVVTENERVLAVAEALEAGDMERVGRLFRESHLSLKDDYEVSIPALDTISDTAEAVEGALGGRMAGAGFGGCGIALVREEAVAEFDRELRRRYRREVAHDPGTYVCRAAAGASVEEL
jgi:galactokinase